MDGFWKILLVDDDEDDYLLTRSMLAEAKYRPFKLEWASSYKDGRAAALQNAYDAILVDYDLGRDNGLALTRELAQSGLRTPLILYTGRGSYDVDVEAMQAGASLYLTKSEVNSLLLERVIRFAIERRQMEEALRDRTRELEASRKEALAEKATLLAAMEALPVGLVILDEKGGVIRANRTYYEVWGGAAPDTQSVADYGAFKAWWVDSGKVLKPEEWASAQAVQKGEAVVGQYLEIERFDGRRAFVLNSASPILGPNEEITGSAVCIQDITGLREVQHALEKSEEHTRQILDSITDAYYLLDSDYRFVYINQQASREWDKPPEELVGKVIWDAFPGADQTESYIKIQQAMKSRQPIYYTTYSVFLDRWVAVTLYPTGKGLSVYFKDITEQKKIEIAKQETEEVLQGFFDTNAVAMSVIELDGDSFSYILPNPRIAEFTGRTVEEFAGINVRQLGFPEAFIRQWVELFRECDETQKPAALEYPLTLMGQETWFYGTVTPIASSRSGNPRFALCAVDITKRKKVEQELASTHEKVTTLLAAIPQGYWLLDGTGRLLDVNAAYCAMSGYSRGELLQMNIKDLEAAEGKEAILAHVRTAWDQGNDQFTSRQRTKDGAAYTVTVRLTRLDHEEGLLMGLIHDDRTGLSAG